MWKQLERLDDDAQAAASTVAKGGTLNLYTWPDYFSTKNLAAYKRETGTTMNISTYESNDILFAKLNSAAGSGFDIVVPTSGWIQTMAHHGLLQKLDHCRIPLQYVSPALLNKVFDPGNVYSIPKDYGVLGVVYDPMAVGGTIKTWQDFLDAGDKKSVSGKVQLSDASWEVVAIPLWAADGDYNTQDTAKIKPLRRHHESLGEECEGVQRLRHYRPCPWHNCYESNRPVGWSSMPYPE